MNMVKAATWIINSAMLVMVAYLYMSYQPAAVDTVAINNAVIEALTFK